MRERDTSLTTDQKALAVNLDKYKFGTIVEIGCRGKRWRAASSRSARGGRNHRQDDVGL